MENDLLRDAFAEANLRSKSLFWAAHPPVLETAAKAAWLGEGVANTLLYSLRWRVAAACDWHPTLFCQGPSLLDKRSWNTRELRNELLLASASFSGRRLGTTSLPRSSRAVGPRAATAEPRMD